MEIKEKNEMTPKIKVSAESGYVDEAHVVELVQVAMVTTGNVILRGETGTGKTFLVHWLTGVQNPEVKDLWEPYGLNPPTLQKFSCHEEQGYVDVVAQDVLADGETKVRRQILLQWLEPTVDAKTPKILLVDEANFLSPSVAGFMHPLCDWQAGIWVPELNEFVKRSPLHWLALCINPYEKSIYAGTKQMNAALSSRFITIDIPYMSMSSETKFLKERFPKADSTVIGRFVAFADKSRKAYKKDFLSVPVTPRNLIQWLDAMEKGQFTIDDIEPMVLGVFPPDQQNQVKGLLEGKKIDDVFKSIVGND